MCAVLNGRKSKHATKNRGEAPGRMQHAQHEGARGAVPERQRVLFKGETKRKRLAIPMYRGAVE
jgi:hypothetical protein